MGGFFSSRRAVPRRRFHEWREGARTDAVAARREDGVRVDALAPVLAGGLQYAVVLLHRVSGEHRTGVFYALVESEPAPDVPTQCPVTFRPPYAIDATRIHQTRSGVVLLHRVSSENGFRHLRIRAVRRWGAVRGLLVPALFVAPGAEPTPYRDGTPLRSMSTQVPLRLTTSTTTSSTRSTKIFVKLTGEGQAALQLRAHYASCRVKAS